MYIFGDFYICYKMVSLFKAQTAQHVIDAVAHGGDVNKVKFNTSCQCHDKFGYGLTPLGVACVKNHTDVVQALLDHGNVAHNNGAALTMIVNVASNGHIDCLDFLLERGADVNLPNNRGFTSLMVACVNRQIDAIDRLLQYGANVNAVTNNTRYNDGTTVLEYASPDVIERINCLLGK